MISEPGDYRLEFFNGVTMDREYLYLEPGSTEDDGVRRVNYFLDVNGNNRVYLRALEILNDLGEWDIV